MREPESPCRSFSCAQMKISLQERKAHGVVKLTKESTEEHVNVQVKENEEDKQMKCNACLIVKRVDVIFSPVEMMTSIRERLGLVAGLRGSLNI